MFAPAGTEWLGDYLKECRAYFEERRVRAAPNTFSPWLSILVEKMPPAVAARPLLFNPIPAWTTKLGCTSFGFEVPTAEQIRQNSYTVSLSGELLKAKWEKVLAEVGAPSAFPEGPAEAAPPDYVIAVRTYNRRETIQQHTLNVLRDLAAPVYIFCGTDEMSMYERDFPQFHIRDGGNCGVRLCNERIADEFAEGQRILQCDDDVLRFEEVCDRGMQPADLRSYVRRGFMLCEQKGFKLFGFYPVANAYFMQSREEVSFGLSFIMGGIHGFINDRKLRTFDNYRDDYERSILSWIHFGGMVRFNRAKACNIIYRNKGGHAQTRTRAAMQDSCTYMLRTYPQFCAPKRCKSKFPEIRLVSPKGQQHASMAACHGGLASEPDPAVGVPNEGASYDDLVRKLRAVQGWHRRNKVMCNKSIIFGFTRSLQNGPSLTDATRANRELVNELMARIRERAPSLCVTSICINYNFCRALHIDNGNIGETYMLTVGAFQGGDLWVYPGTTESTRDRWVSFDGRVPHCTYPFEGERYSIIFFASKHARDAPERVRVQMREYGFDTVVPESTTTTKPRATLLDAVRTLPTSLASCVPPHITRRAEDPPDASHLPMPPMRWIQRTTAHTDTDDDGRPPVRRPEGGETRHRKVAAAVEKRKRAAEAAFQACGKAPRVLRTDAKAYDPRVLRYKLCDRDGHVGERLLPLTEEHFYISKSGYACKQCKRRAVRAASHERKRARPAADGAAAAGDKK